MVHEWLDTNPIELCWEGDLSPRPCLHLPDTWHCTENCIDTAAEAPDTCRRNLRTWHVLFGDWSRLRHRPDWHTGGLCPGMFPMIQGWPHHGSLNGGASLSSHRAPVEMQAAAPCHV